MYIDEQGKKWFQEQYNNYLKDYAKKNKIKMTKSQTALRR